MLQAGLILCRWLHFSAVTGLFGLALFRIYAPRTALAAPRTGASLAAIAALALVSGLAWFYFTAGAMGGGLAWATIPTVVTDTDFGPIWAARMALALVLCGPAIARKRIAYAVLSGVLLISIALTGHARVHEGALGWLQAGNDAVHLAAAGAWLGALTAFLVLFRTAPTSPETARALVDFSTIGLLSVAALLVSGAANTWLILGGLAPLPATSYGRLLLLKVALFALMVALAADNRLRLVPAMVKEHGGALDRLRTHVLGEQALGLAVLLLVAVLGTLDPSA